MGCRFPHANGIDAYWAMLAGNVDAVRPIPRDRFDVDRHYDPIPGSPGKTVSRHGGCLDDVFGFDAGFFGVSPREAATVDPQQRLLLHVAWEALEHAGIRPSKLAGSRTGVFVGQATSEYEESCPQHDIRNAAGSRIRAVTAGRLSYALDLRGPSLVIDTACSSSLVAVHLARQSLLAGESELALAAGVNVILSPTDAVAYSQGEMLSPDGRCKFADVAADGFVRSEGVGVVALKRLSDAQRDGNPILALLPGSAVSNDGKGSDLLLQPAVSGQVEMLRQAAHTAGIHPSQLDYVEAHGTGTQVGDTVELQALTCAMAQDHGSQRPLQVGSVKSNIGHTEAAAGIAGLIKAVLIARRRIVPASLHINTPHPLLDERELPIEAVRTNRPLTHAGPRALLGVSSFGISGTNAHVIVRQPEPATGRREGRTDTVGDAETVHNGLPCLLVLSARSPRSLRRLARSYADYLGPRGRGSAYDLGDICFTAATRRDHHPYRLWVIGTSHEDVARKLRALAAGEDISEGGLGEAGFGGEKQTVFVFPGQGSQWLGMGRGMLAESRTFRRAMTECDEAVRAELGWSVIDVLTSDREDVPTEVEVVQPVLWAMEVALAAVWQAMGVEPDVCVGHSMGETAAAYVSGALTLRDSAAVICRRSQLMARLAGRGAMLAVELPAAELRGFVEDREDRVCVAAENSPTATVLAGAPDSLDVIADRLDEQEVFCRLVKVNVASHSPDMDLLRDDLIAALNGLLPSSVDVPMVSTTRCAAVRGPDLDAAYWMDNLRQPVRFVETVQTVAKDCEAVFVEVSPHPVLTGAIRQTQDNQGLPEASVPTLLARQDESASMAKAAGALYGHGGRISWERWFSSDAQCVTLPSYEWDTEEFRHSAPPTPVADRRVRELSMAEWGADKWGVGTSLHGLTPIPPVVYFEAALQAARSASDTAPVALEQVRLGDELVDMATAEDTTLRVTLQSSDDSDLREVAVEAVRPVEGTPKTTLCMKARARTVGGHSGSATALDVDQALRRCAEYQSAAEFHSMAANRGYEIPDAFRAVSQLWRTEGAAVARMRCPEVGHPVALESALQPIIAAWPVRGAHAANCAYLPLSFDRVELSRPLPEEFWSVVRFVPESRQDPARADITLFDPDGGVLAEFTGLRMRKVPDAASSPSRSHRMAARLREQVTTTASSTARRAAVTLLSPVARFTDRLSDTHSPSPHTPTARPNAPRNPAPPIAEAAPSRPRSAPEGSATTAVAEEQYEAVFLRCVATVLGTSPDRLDLRRPLRDYGLDSLMAAQLRKRLHHELGVELPTSRLLGKESLGKIADNMG